MSAIARRVVGPTAQWTGPVVSAAMGLSALARGADFLSASVTPVEALTALGLTTWGIAFTVLGIALIVGSTAATPPLRRSWVLSSAHMLAVGIYAAYLVAVVQSGVHEWRPFVFPLSGLVIHAARAVDVMAEARVRRAVRISIESERCRECPT